METDVGNRDRTVTDGDLLTVDEVIRWLRLGRTRTNELLRSGEITSYKLGRRRLVRRRDVEAWLQEQRYEPAKEY